MGNNVDTKPQNTDSGATEHLTNSSLIFKELDGSTINKIKCANNSPHADLQVSGEGTVEISLDDGSIYKLKNVVCAKDLSVNLLSLRKFVDQGLSIYLNNKVFNMIDPVTRQD